MNYFLPETLRNALLEWCEEYADLTPHDYGWEDAQRANKFATQLRDLKPLRQTEANEELVAALQALIDNPGPRKMDEPIAAHKKLHPHIVAVSNARKLIAKYRLIKEPT